MSLSSLSGGDIGIDHFNQSLVWGHLGQRPGASHTSLPAAYTAITAVPVMTQHHQKRVKYLTQKSHRWEWRGVQLRKGTQEASKGIGVALLSHF